MIAAHETFTTAAASAFAPFVDAFKTMGVPQETRELVRRAATTGQERAADLHAGCEKLTASLEHAAQAYLGETTKISRTVQQALHEDAEAFFANLGKLAGARSFGEVAEIQSQYLRARAEIATQRTRSSVEYLGKLVSEGAKTVQDNVANVVPLRQAA